MPPVSHCDNYLNAHLLLLLHSEKPKLRDLLKVTELVQVEWGAGYKALIKERAERGRGDDGLEMVRDWEAEDSNE